MPPAISSQYRLATSAVRIYVALVCFVCASLFLLGLGGDRSLLAWPAMVVGAHGMGYALLMAVFDMSRAAQYSAWLQEQGNDLALKQLGAQLSDDHTPPPPQRDRRPAARYLEKI